MSTKVWDRRGEHALEKRAFMGSVSGLFLAGIIFCAWASNFSSDWDLSGWQWYQLLGFMCGFIFVVVIASMTAYSSTNPLVSLPCYTVIAGAYGLLIGPFVAQHTDADVTKVLFMTAVLVFALGLLGIALPDLAGWRFFLFGGMIALLVGWLGVFVWMWVSPSTVDPALSIIEWAGVLLFSALTVFHMNKLKYVQRTFDNAVDCSIDLFCSTVGLFIYLLGASSNNR